MLPVRMGRKRHPSPRLHFLVFGIILGMFITAIALGQMGPAATGVSVLPARSQPTPTRTPQSNRIALPLDQSSRARQPTPTAETAFQEAPDFSLPTLDGDTITLSELRGYPVVLNFWASWCPPCRLEMPALVEAYETYREDRLMILGMNMTYQDTVDDAREFVETYDVTYPTLLDNTGDVSRDRYRIMGVPTSIFINREGYIVRTHLGAMNRSQIDAFIQEILDETT